MLKAEPVGIVARDIAAMTGYDVWKPGLFLNVSSQGAGRDDKMRVNNIVVLLSGQL